MTLVAIVLTLPLLADDRSKEALSSTHTDQIKVAAAGTIRLDNSFGEVDVEGWDRTEVELTVIRSTEHFYGEKDRAEAQRRLDSVKIETKQEGNDLVIATSYPPQNAFLHPLSRRSDIEVAYRIKAPRATRLIVEHNRGGVNVSDIGGDIHATVINGQITLTLNPAAKFSIDARCGLGSVYSDFEGRDQRRHVLGEAFGIQSAAPAANLYLRTRVGDIVIQKLPVPPTS
jgi:hypothetical protein